MLRLSTETFLSRRSLREIAAAAGRESWSEEGFLRLARRGRAADTPWRERCLAAFLLEMGMAGSAPGDSVGRRFLLDLLTEGGWDGSEEPEPDHSGDPLGRLSRLRQRLTRHAHIHRLLRQDAEDPAALALLQGLLESEWRLLLARYLITPQEVLARIRQLTRTSWGLLDTDVGEHAFYASESSRALDELPAYEAAIARGLMEEGEIWWVDDSTPSQVGSLVEYPLGSIVLVVRPPGSDWELELKRAGRRGPNPLRVYFSRGGRQLPKAHRLDCGSPSRHLRFEAGASTTFSRLLRLSQGRPAPLGRPLGLRSVHSVPGPDGEDVLLLAYLSDPTRYGEDFPRLQSELEDVLDAYQREDDWEPPPLGGDIGRATLFLTQAAPGQMLLAGTSSFRLDRLALYLAPQGYRQYRQQLGHEHPGGRAAFEDLLLDVILGDWEDAEPGPPGERIPALLAANRGRADAIYLGLMRQAAQVWGALLAVRGYSSGESFVARNVGLRGCWEGARRRPQLVFLDHDNLHLPPPGEADYSPNKVIRNTYLDWKAILGGPLGGNNWLPESRRPLQRLIGLKGHLKRIYGITPETEAKGDEAFDESLSASYRRTQEEVASNPDLGEMFAAGFRRRLRHWDRTAREYLAAQGDSEALEAWKTRTRRRLAEQEVSQELIEEYLERPAASLAFVRRFAFLWEP